MGKTKMGDRTLTRRGVLASTGAALLGVAGLGGCSPASQEQSATDVRCGSILTSDGVVLAQSEEAGKGYRRTYPAGSLAAALVGCRPLVLAGAYNTAVNATDKATDPGTAGSLLPLCYEAYDSEEGQAYLCLEQEFRSDLEAGLTLTTTLDARIQKAAEQALGDAQGAVVVLECATGAVRALASSPTADLGQVGTSATDGATLPDGLKNRALDLHIPGSLQKTVILATALGQGAAVTDIRPVSNVEMIDGNAIENASDLASDTYTLGQAYAESLNTVYGPLALEIGLDALLQTADQLGYGSLPLADFPGMASRYQPSTDSSRYQIAWECLGQSLYVGAHLEGPLVNAVHMASVCATVCNGGLRVQPYVVSGLSQDGQSAEGLTVGERTQALTPEVAAGLREAMLLTTAGGTGTSARVNGVQVGGKTGTGTTAQSTYNGWFCGFATKGEKSYAVALLAQNATSAQASALAGQVIGQIFAES